MKSWFKENKQKIWPFLVIFILAGSFVLYYMYTASPENVSNKAAQGNAAPSSSSSSITISDNNNPFNHEGTLSEVKVQNYIHGMSHQKVKAESKWVHYNLTQERVEWLLEQVQNAGYQYEDIYIDILTKWQQGDFTSADKDHNRVWVLLGGTVGKATGVYTEDEEKEYLKRHGKNQR
jgi:hypothetical protein